MSSSASSSRSNSPEPQVRQNKRKREGVSSKKKEEIASDESDSESDNSASEHENDEPSTAEEQVLSHKERRKKKKEEKLAAKLAESGKALKKRKLKDGTAQVVDASSATAKRQNSVWVGNMSYKTTQESLKSFFKECGEITRIHMPTKAPSGPGMKPENRGFAYVDFATSDAKVAAIALSEQPLLGRKLLIKDGDDFKGRPAAVAGDVSFSDPALAHKTHSKTAQKILRAQKQPPAPTLFFGNLGFETTEESIRQLLEAHRLKKKGKEVATDPEDADAKPKEKDNWIRKVRMGTFEDSGLCKGFAFVDFTSVEHATAALINPKNHHLNGRNLVVEYASPDAVRRGAPKGKSADGSARKVKGTPRPNRPKGHSEETKETDHKPEEDAHTTEAAVDVAETPAAKSSPKKQRDNKERAGAKPEGVRQKGPKSRPKPGAALALAKRESAAIVPSQGQKITF